MPPRKFARHFSWGICVLYIFGNWSISCYAHPLNLCGMSKEVFKSIFNRDTPVTIYPLADSHYLNLLNHSWPSDRLVVSLISGQGYFTFLYKYTRHNVHNQEVEEKKDKQARTWVISKCKRFVTLLCGFLVHLWANTSVYSSEIPTQPLGTLTHPLTLANPATGSVGLSSSLSSRLSLTVAFPRLLLTTFFCSLHWDLAFPNLLPVP